VTVPVGTPPTLLLAKLPLLLLAAPHREVTETVTVAEEPSGIERGALMVVWVGTVVTEEVTSTSVCALLLWKLPLGT
jgi:hypothetical protein